MVKSLPQLYDSICLRYLRPALCVYVRHPRGEAALENDREILVRETSVFLGEEFLVVPGIPWPQVLQPMCMLVISNKGQNEACKLYNSTPLPNYYILLCLIFFPKLLLGWRFTA